MARLIDADKINYHDHTECMGHGDFETVRTVTDKEIAEIPTADAVPVVRCRDCKWFAENNGGEWYGCWLFSAILENEQEAPREDDFCSYGERKDGDGNG